MSTDEIDILQKICQFPLVGRMTHCPVPSNCPDIMNLAVFYPHLDIYERISGSVEWRFLQVDGWFVRTTKCIYDSVPKGHFYLITSQ